MNKSSNNGLVDILEELVSFKSVEDDLDQKYKLNEHIYKQLNKIPGKLEKFNRNGIPSLVYATNNIISPKILLQAHLDVVPASDESFAMKIVEDKLYGRGVYDMKFAAACYLFLLNELGNTINEYDFGIMFTFDEEVGGENGVGYLLEIGFGAEVCLLPDGGDNWNLETECNGVWLLDIIAKGKTSHGSRPWEGENAIDKLLDALHQIKKLFPMDNSDKNTVTISRIQGGEALNQVPSEAKCTIDMRFVDQQSYYKKRIEIEKLVYKLGLEVETIARLDSFALDVNETYVQDFLKIASKVYGKPIKYGRSYGASDAHYFNSKNIPTLLIRPNGGGAHSESEWIEIEGLVKFYEVIKTYVTTYSRIA